LEYIPTNEQKLIDIMFKIGILIHEHKSFKKMNREQVEHWIAKQLKDSGFVIDNYNHFWILREIL